MGGIEHKADIMSVLRIFTERDEHCTRVGQLFPQVPELIALLLTQRLASDPMTVDGLAVIRTWFRFPNLVQQVSQDIVFNLLEIGNLYLGVKRNSESQEEIL